MKALSKNMLSILLVMFSLTLAGCASDAKKDDGSASESVVDDSSAANPLDLNGTSDDNTAGGLANHLLRL